MDCLCDSSLLFLFPRFWLPARSLPQKPPERCPRNRPYNHRTMTCFGWRRLRASARSDGFVPRTTVRLALSGRMPDTPRPRLPPSTCSHRRSAFPTALSGTDWSIISGRMKPMSAESGDGPRRPNTRRTIRLGRLSWTSTNSPQMRARTGSSKAPTYSGNRIRILSFALFHSPTVERMPWCAASSICGRSALWTADSSPQRPSRISPGSMPIHCWSAPIGAAARSPKAATHLC